MLTTRSIAQREEIGPHPRMRSPTSVYQLPLIAYIDDSSAGYAMMSINHR